MEQSIARKTTAARSTPHARVFAPITEEVFQKATERGQSVYKRGAKSVRLDSGRRLVVLMRNGSSAIIPISEIPVRVIAEAPTSKLKNVEIGPMGDHIWFPQIDEGFNVAALLELSFGSTMRADSGRRGGAKKSPAKAAAARANGLKGGRRKQLVKA